MSEQDSLSINSVQEYDAINEEVAESSVAVWKKGQDSDSKLNKGEAPRVRAMARTNWRLLRELEDIICNVIHGHAEKILPEGHKWSDHGVTSGAGEEDVVRACKTFSEYFGGLAEDLKETPEARDIARVIAESYDDGLKEFKEWIKQIREQLRSIKEEWEKLESSMRAGSKQTILEGESVKLIELLKELRKMLVEYHTEYLPKGKLLSEYTAIADDLKNATVSSLGFSQGEYPKRPG